MEQATGLNAAQMDFLRLLGHFKTEEQVDELRQVVCHGAEAGGVAGPARGAAVLALRVGGGDIAGFPGTYDNESVIVKVAIIKKFIHLTQTFPHPANELSLLELSAPL